MIETGRKILSLFVLALIVVACMAMPVIAASPSYPPIKGEYYPVEGQGYPEKKTSPYAKPRVIPFQGEPLEIYLQLNMMTQIKLPAPPIHVQLGMPEKFTTEVVPELNMVSLKPHEEIVMTNLIVTTERGVYFFILKENPFRPWDIYVQVTDPYKQVVPTDPSALILMAYKGERPAEFQFTPLEMRSPESSTYFFDPLTRMGCSVSLKRAVVLPKQGKRVFWVRFTNVLPPDVQGRAESFMVDERSVWIDGLERVAVPGTRTEGVPILGKGQGIDMFLIASGSSQPSSLRLRFAMQGSRNIPVEVVLPLSGKAASIGAASTVDEKLQALYEETMKKGQIETVLPEEVPVLEAPSAPAKPSKPASQPGPAQKPESTGLFPNVPYFPEP